MHAIVSHYYRKVPIDNALREEIEREVADELQRCEGFQSYHLLHASGDLYIAIGIFDSEEQLARGLERVMPWVRERFAPEFSRSPERFFGDVIVERINSTAG